MPQTTTVPPTTSTFVHTELVSDDVQATRDFFTRTFRWTFEDTTAPGAPPYTFVRDGRGNSFGGLRPVDDDEPGPAVVDYIGVEDVDATARTVEQNGGTILVPVQAVGGLGRMFVFEAPGGTVFGCWQDTTPR